MKKKQIDSGRIKQKRETRNGILKAAQELLETNPTFSLEDVARHMGISRATIYRYYSNIDLLYTEATLSFRVKQPADFIEEVKELSLLETLTFVQRYYNHLAQLHENSYRRYMSIVLSESLKEPKSGPLRGARRPATLEVVLEPYEKKIGKENIARLKHIVTVLSGIEPMIANKDVNGLSSEQSDRLLAWALEMIVKGMGLDDTVD
ncbi:transcriptional regulator, TetR family [Dyadobacter koreensis]|uniref:Transcriptional regulator, TetR family n=1 Tax=Dyadobacter koreensis TaxID=408657 RepID=A0A1H6QJ55_9BACT|nr:TetR/AcrR family transcriptional regulator [Dyadobacter koreensis]SEI39295.1 transcriptional regulator, TetR family [Dyadobacter koreensis]